MTAQKKILFVEDEPDIVMMYDVKFKKAGYNFFTAPSAKAALKLVKQQKPDIILLDIKLEGDLSGIDVLRELKSHAKTKAIPVIVFSNAYKKQYADQVKELGASAVVSKSQILPEDTIHLVEQYLN